VKRRACLTIAVTLKPLSRYLAIASFFSVLSGIIVLLPPVWHAAQLPLNTSSPISLSSASAGAAVAAARAPESATAASAVRALRRGDAAAEGNSQRAANNLTAIRLRG
jgi:hypothetical protein